MKKLTLAAVPIMALTLSACETSSNSAGEARVERPTNPAIIEACETGEKIHVVCAQSGVEIGVRLPAEKVVSYCATRLFDKNPGRAFYTDGSIGYQDSCVKEYAAGGPE